MTVYAKIENNELITAYNGYNGIVGFADNVELCIANGFIAYDEELVAKYYAGIAKIQDNVLVDISSTDEYKAEILAKEKAAKKSELFAQIDELDIKSIRALREGGFYDETTGMTYLEHYTQQIIEIRAQIAQL